jgi:carboxyl-terminal processing protease
VLTSLTGLLVAWVVLGVPPGGDAARSERGSHVEETYRRLTVFAEVLDYIESGFIGNTPGRVLIDDAIRGLLMHTDVRSRYLTAPEHARALAMSQDCFGGIGLDLLRSDRQILVRSIVPESPAEHAGLTAGDRLLTVDGQSVSSAAMSDIVVWLRGEPGSQVRLGVWPEFARRPRDVVVKRSWVHPTPVSAQRLSRRVGYVRVSGFTAGVADEVRMWSNAFRRRDPVDGLILDLRDNAGGRLSEAVAVADLWIAGGVLLRTERKYRPEEEVLAHSTGTDVETPLVVLVDGGTASAAELLAGALQDHHRATLVGDQTFGKASVQTFITLHDGAVLKLTVGSYRTAGRRTIEGHGISPDVRMPSPLEPLFIRPLSLNEAIIERDPPVAKAMSLLSRPAEP